MKETTGKYAQYVHKVGDRWYVAALSEKTGAYYIYQRSLVGMSARKYAPSPKELSKAYSTYKQAYRFARHMFGGGYY